ncbi:MAG: squalene/phytoene synthase family protein [Pseudomonadota bacterium]
MADAEAHSAPADPILASARAFEPDRYYAALMTPSNVRDDLMVLAAFAGEIARIPAFVTEPMMGEIRLQWWRDALSVTVATGHPIADPLRAALAKHALPADVLDPAIDATTDLLKPAPFDDLAALEHHFAARDGTLFRAAAVMLGRADADADAAAAAAFNVCGAALGFAVTAVEVPAVLAQGRTLVPRSLLNDHGIPDLDRLPRGPGGRPVAEPWRAIRIALADHAAERFAAARKALHAQDRRVITACRPMAMVPPYCRLIRRLLPEQGLASRDVLPLHRFWRIWRGISVR